MKKIPYKFHLGLKEFYKYCLGQYKKSTVLAYFYRARQLMYNQNFYKKLIWYSAGQIRRTKAVLRLLRLFLQIKHVKFSKFTAIKFFGVYYIFAKELTVLTSYTELAIFDKYKLYSF